MNIQNFVWGKADNTKTDAAKPFMLLITGDVPVFTSLGTNPDKNGDPAHYPISPFANNTVSEWKTDIQKYYSALRYLPTFVYNGTCPDQSKGIGWDVIAIGGANWVNADGSVRAPAAKASPFVVPSFSATANASALYDQLGDFFNKAPVPAPLAVYPVDPLMMDNKDVTLRTEMRNSMNDLIGMIRCTHQSVLATKSSKQGQFTASLPVSALYQRVQITVDYAPNTQITLSAPGTTGAVKDGDPGVKLAIQPAAASPATSRQVWVLTRDARGTAQWEGNWAINALGSNTDAPQILVEPLIDLQTLNWQPDSAANKPVVADTPYVYHLKLLINGKPFQDSQLIDPVTWKPENQPVISFTADGTGTGYSGTLPQAMTSAVSTYTVGVHITFKQPIGGQQAIDLPLLPDTAAPGGEKITISVQTKFGEIQPGGGLLRCEGGIAQFSVPVALSGQRSSASLESLGTYTQVEMYYPPLATSSPVLLLPTAAATAQTSAAANAPKTAPLAVLEATPFARLPIVPAAAGDASINFQTNVDCSRLPLLGGAPFPIEFVAHFPDDKSIQTVLNYNFNPTSTPAPTATPFLPTATPIATATPEPLSPDPVGDLRQTASQPFMLIVAGVLALPLGGWLLPRLFMTYRRALLPLYTVRIQTGERGISRPVRRFPWRYLPHTDHFTLRSQTARGKPIGTVRVRSTGEPEVSNLVEGARVQVITTARRPRVRIDYQDETFVLINNTL